MSNCNSFEQLDQIQTLISSTVDTDRSCAYSMLLQLQEQSTTDDLLSQSLVKASQPLLSFSVKDAQHKDEEISALALKCLGFMIYFPPIVSKIPEDTAGAVLEMLAGVIMSTKMKIICNLAVWCLSIQNLDPSVLASHSASLVRAIAHSLDNPTGSLSTTFEGTQVVIKLANQVKKTMKDTSSIWGTPIIRRLVSADKKERDMCQRCLLKVETTIYPPSLPLSKAIFQAMKPKLLPGLIELLKHGKKVQALQAWRWFILLMGSHAVKNRQLVNELLKVPEQTFSDHDPQVQVASLVAWEGLIDVLIGLPLNVSAISLVEEKKSLEGAGMMKRSLDKVKTDKYMKSLKLIMKPLVGIMSGQCDASVQSACLSTWCYLLHKLDIYVNESSVISTVVEPIFEVVFQIGQEDGNNHLCDFCIHLLDDFIQSKHSNESNEATNYIKADASTKKCYDRSLMSSKCSWKVHSVRWLPWDCSQLDFLLRMLYHIISWSTGSKTSISNRYLSSEWVLRNMHCLFKGVQLDFGRLSTSYDDILQSLKTILKFVNCACEAVVSVDVVNVNLLATSLQLIKIITEELDPALLGSPLYSIGLDFKHMSNIPSVGHVSTMLPGIGYSHRLDMTLPITYLTKMYFLLLIHMTRTTDIELVQQEIHNYLKILLSSHNPLENIHTIVGLLYDYCDASCLRLWLSVAQGVQEFLDSATNLMQLNTDSRDGCNFSICHLFIFPLIMSFSQKLSLVTTSKDSILLKPCDAHASSQRKAFEEVKKTWTSLYCSIIACTQQKLSLNTFAQDLFLLLIRFLDSNLSMSKCATESMSVDIPELNFLSLCGELVICVLDNIQIRKPSSRKHDSDCKITSGMDSCFEFIARVLKLTAIAKKSETLAISDVIQRTLLSLTQYVRRLELREDIHGFSKVICDALIPWMSNSEAYPEIIIPKLQLLWSEILTCLQKSEPAIIFDSSCLQLQAAFLKITLDHPIPSIRDSTISFWNFAYGDQTGLDFPPCLTTVLDKLSREGKIKINNIRPRSGLDKDDSVVACNYKVTTTLNMNSKRVELIEESERGHDCMDKPQVTVKRQRREFTEHQKEVRRAQQGRERDCGGHGPGIRTYTGLDFSQGNEYDDSQDQESQEGRNPDLILELLKRPS